MDVNIELLEKLIEPVLYNLGFELLELQFVPGRKKSILRITIDKDAGYITISDCEIASRRISRMLDVENPIEGSYILEVSSPGFKRILRIPKDLKRFINHKVKIRLSEPIDDKTVFTGILKSAENPLELEQIDMGIVRIPFDIILKANLDD